MNEEKAPLDTKAALSMAAGLIALAALILPLGLGIIYGAGVGWIALGLIALAGAYRIVDVAKKAEAKQIAERKGEIE